MLGAMCGRYAASADRAQVVEVFSIDEIELARSSGAQRGTEAWLQPRWNIAPTDTVAAVVEKTRDDGRERLLVGLQWGLVPSWSKDAKGAARLINARLETVAEKPSFRKALAARRCLIPADGYYEWYQTQQLDARGKPIKQPFYIHPTNGVRVDDHPGLVAMAGLYEYWKDPNPVGDDDPWLVSCSIITTVATDELGVIHDRMPVTVAPDAWDAWLDVDEVASPEALDLVATPAVSWSAYAVERLVSSIRNDGPELIRPME